MEAAGFSETLIYFYHTAWLHVPEGGNLQESYGSACWNNYHGFE
jgi:hypothetical protein